MTLRARLALGFLTIALLLAIPLAEAARALQQARNAVEALRDEPFTASLLLARVRSATGQLRRADLTLAVRHGDSTSAQDLEHEVRALAALADSLRRFRIDTLDRTMRASVAELQQFVPIEIAALADGRTDLADRVSEQHVAPAINAVEERLASAEERLRELARRQVDDAATAAGEAWQLAGLLLAIAVVASAVVAVWITRSISRPVQDLHRGMEAVANGRFTHRLAIAAGRDDEFGQLATSFESMASQLAELDKLKAEFVSIASHELKTPINVIMGYLKLLEENLYGPLSDRQLEVVGIMQNQSSALARLVQHLLDVSRFQAGAARLEVRPVTLRGFLAQLEATYEVLALQRGITFSVVAAETLPDVVTWDVDRINEVLGNLLSNAFKFTADGGRVDLRVSSLEDALYVEVRDTGVGISPAQLPHIFDKFFQADNQAGASAKGSGLGLAISKEIVEAHGGSIAAESEVGVGTKFSLMLPVSAETTSGVAIAPEEREVAGSAPSRARAGATA